MASNIHYLSGRPPTDRETGRNNLEPIELLALEAAESGVNDPGNLQMQLKVDNPSIAIKILESAITKLNTGVRADVKNRILKGRISPTSLLNQLKDTSNSNEDPLDLDDFTEHRDTLLATMKERHTRVSDPDDEYPDDQSMIL